ncbi:MAG TPA: DNRLRE domain-containing protein, partial [Candidatus Faecousia intestinigallinarum]|nr:DNRLRE domain-containing protein [Candidatus Faecousia intestinigallinarum]
MKRGIFWRSISFLLVIALALQMLPLPALAAAADPTLPAEDGSGAYAANAVPDEVEAAAEPASILGENEALRGEEEKHFRLSDGSSILVSYGMPVHYPDANGMWQEIDNRLESVVAADGQAVYQTTDQGNAASAFSAKLSTGRLFTSRWDDLEVSMSLMTAAQRAALLHGAEEHTETLEETVPKEPPTQPEEETQAVTEPVLEPNFEAVDTATTPDAFPETSTADTAFSQEPAPADGNSNGETTAEASTSTTDTETAEIPEETQETAAETPEESFAETQPATDGTETQQTLPPESAAPMETEPTEPETLDWAPGDYDPSVTAQIISDIPMPFLLEESAGWRTEDVIPEHLYSSVLYENVYPGVDLQYTAYGYNIKEQIIVREKQEEYRYDFLLQLDGLTPVLQDNGSVTLLNDENTVIYEIPAPYMADAQGVHSQDVVYSLTALEDCAILHVEADAAWINDETRAFPVMIDPTLVVQVQRATVDSSADIYATYVIEDTPNSVQGSFQNLYLGYSSMYGEHWAYLHFKNLPTLPAGSVITGAALNMYMFNYSHVGCSELPIEICEVTGSNTDPDGSYYDWLYYMTWNTKPAVDTANVLDFAVISEDTDNTYASWDLTRVIKKWYAEGTENRTLAMLPGDRGTYSWNHCAAAVCYAYGPYYRPILMVAYRGNVGIEPYYTYETMGAGHAGTAYLADATGQLKAVKSVASYASTVNPFTLNLVYNSDYFSVDPSGAYAPMEKLGLSMNAGSGWTLDCVQKVEPEVISGITYLRYSDGDGTVHYFSKDSSKDSAYYYDEDGLGLKIKEVSSSVYEMSDDKGNTRTFTNGYLTALTDTNGNQILMKYNSGKLTSVTQKNSGCPEITVASFTYSGSSLTAIQDAAGNRYTLTYSDGNLTGLSRNGTSLVQYLYTGRRLSQMKDLESSYAIAYTYQNGKVSTYKELGGSSSGIQASVTYMDASQTTYRDYGADRTANTADDLLTHYLFDYAGRTVNAYTTDNAGTILGASNAAYTGSNSTDKTNNRTLRTASIGLASRQLLADSGFESGSWTLSSGASISTTRRHSGNNAIKITGNGKASKTVSSLTAGTVYTLSGYINTLDMTTAGLYGAGILITAPDGNVFQPAPLYEKTIEMVDNGWQQMVVTFTAPVSGAYTVSVEGNAIGGAFYVDDLLLEAADAPSSRNLLENGNVQSSGASWNMNPGASYQAGVGVDTIGGAGSIKIIGQWDEQNGNAWQDVPINLPSSQTYVLSGWAKANSVPDTEDLAASADYDQFKQFGLRALLYYSDGTFEYHFVPFNPDLTTWQFTSMTIVPRQSNKTVSKIKVLCAYERNANTAYFDNISLVLETAQTMEYDEDGNLVAVGTTGLNKETSVYEGGNLIQAVTGGYGAYTYAYDSHDNLTSVTDGVLTETLTYSAQGNVTGTTLQPNSGGSKMTSSASYDTGGNRITSITDSTGGTVAYAYSGGNSQMLGLPTTVTDARGAQVTNAYDFYGRTTEVSIANAASAVYTYTQGNLSALTRTAGSAAQTYTLGYDSFGNMTSFQVGNRNLANYSYQPGNGLLSQQTYGNGDSVSLTYDHLGRVTAETFSDGRTVSHVYNGEGDLYQTIDLGAMVRTNYVYDSLGRLRSSLEQRAYDIMTYRLYIDQAYNKNNQLSKLHWQISYEDFYQEYTYNTSSSDAIPDGVLTGMTIGNGDTLSLSYDALGRLTGRTAAGRTAQSYTYANGAAGTTTPLVSRFVNRYNGAAKVDFSYTYDAAGNILTQQDALGSNSWSYTYDAQNQLTQAAGSGKTYAYTYDGAGNLLTASDGNATHTYTYGDPDWKDLLTAYDGHAITYDAIGNPTSYYNGMTMRWIEGRKLDSLTVDGETVSFVYTRDG